MTHEEMERVKEQILAFVERVSGDDLTKKMPEEVEALPALMTVLINLF